jgi:hypothetical protein
LLCCLCFSFGLAIVNGNHGLGPSASEVILHATCCLVLHIGPCGRNFGIICNNRGLNSKSKERGIFFETILLGGFLGGRTPLGPDPTSQSFLSGVTHALHSPMNVRKFFFLFGRDLGTWNVADSAWADVKADSVDVPSCAHFDLIVPVRPTLGVFRSEVFPRLSNRQFELVALLVVFYHGAGKLLVYLVQVHLCHQVCLFLHQCWQCLCD